MKELFKKNVTKAAATQWLVMLGAVGALSFLPATTTHPAVSDPDISTTFSGSDMPLTISADSSSFSLSEGPGIALVTPFPSNSALSAASQTDAGKDTVSISGLTPQTTYHLYHGSVRDHKNVRADSSGTISFSSDSSDTTFFALTSATPAGFIHDDESGGDCSRFGTWDWGTKTCTMVADIEDAIVIVSPSITLDGANHTVTTDYRETGMSVHSQGNITIRNLHITGHGSWGIFATDSNQLTIVNNTIEAGLSAQIRLEQSSDYAT